MKSSRELICCNACAFLSGAMEPWSDRARVLFDRRPGGWPHYVAAANSRRTQSSLCGRRSGSTSAVVVSVCQLLSDLRAIGKQPLIEVDSQEARITMRSHPALSLPVTYSPGTGPHKFEMPRRLRHEMTYNEVAWWELRD